MSVLNTLILLVIWFSKTLAQEPITVAEPKLEAKICDMILDMPEVRKADYYTRKVTHGKRHLFTYVGSRPTSPENYYTVNVAEDNGFSYHTCLSLGLIQKRLKFNITIQLPALICR